MLTSFLVNSWSLAALSGKAKRMIGKFGNRVVLDLFSSFMTAIKGTRDNSAWAIFWKDDSDIGLRCS